MGIQKPHRVTMLAYSSGAPVANGSIIDYEEWESGILYRNKPIKHLIKVRKGTGSSDVRCMLLYYLPHKDTFQQIVTSASDNTFMAIEFRVKARVGKWQVVEYGIQDPERYHATVLGPQDAIELYMDA